MIRFESNLACVKFPIAHFGFNNTLGGLTLSIISFIVLAVQLGFAQPEKHRLMVLADMGNEPDEVQQMVHLMLYANEFEVEGLIAVTGKFLNPQQKRPYRRVLHPELFHEIIDGYEQVLSNLKKHAEDWPEPDYLRSIVKKGQADYGIEGTGDGRSTEGSDLIKACLLKDDIRPLYLVVNAGSNTLAQALVELEQEHTHEDMKKLLSKLRVYENGAQDNAGAWICQRYPSIHWIRSNFQTYSYGGPSWESKNQEDKHNMHLGPHSWQPFEYSAMGQHHWSLTHVIGNHGMLGKVYPLRQTHNGKIVFLEGGGTIPWLGLIHQGLTSVNHPHWGGWSGRFTKEKVKNSWSKHQSVKIDEKEYGDFYQFIDDADEWTDKSSGTKFNSIYAPVWRWRQAFFNDFQCRMDWCFESYENANHQPVAAVNGDRDEKIHIVSCKAGDSISFDASLSTDPDGDVLQYIWWIYPEAGNYSGSIELTEISHPHLDFHVPKDALGKEIHLILQVNDQNKIASLVDYRRIILEVE